MTPAEDLTTLRNLIASQRFRYSGEAELQAGIKAVLQHHYWTVAREVALTPEDRIDLIAQNCRGWTPPLAWAGDTLLPEPPASPVIGIEVKVAGAPAAVLRQLIRYAQHTRIEGLLLVTTRAAHSVPEVLEGKPVQVVRIGRVA